MASEIRVNQIQSRTGVSTISFTETGPIISGVTTITGDLDVTGLVSYDDVTNIDSVGVITARSGVNVTGGSIGIGTDNPNQELHIHASGTSYVQFTDEASGTGSTNGAVFGLDNPHLYAWNYQAGDFVVATNALERLRITSTGRIGINQASPEAMLQVDYDYANSEVGLRLRAASGSGTKTWQLSEVNGNAGVFSIRNQTNSTEGLDIHGDGHVRVPTGDLRVGDNTDSNAGSQTISVGSVSSGSGGIGIFANPTNGNSFVQFGDGTSSTDQYRGYMNYRHADDSLRFGTVNTDRLIIDSNGRQSFYTDGSLRMHLNATGLGVNTNTITGGRLIHAHNTGTGSAYFQSTNSNTGEASNSGALFGMSGTNCYAPWNYTNGPVIFATNASEKMRIHATGEVTKSSQPLAIIGTTQNNWSPSVGDTLPFDYSNTNRGNHYNTSNYTFTCPVAGDYMVILRLSRKGWTGDVELAKNNSQYVRLELRETGRNSSNAADWQAWCYDFIVPCAANDTLKFKAPSVTSGTGGGNYLLDGYNHIYYDSVTYYLIG